MHSAALSEPSSPAVQQASNSLLARLASLPQASQELVKQHAVEPMMQTVLTGALEDQQAAMKGLALMATNPTTEEYQQVITLFI